LGSLEDTLAVVASIQIDEVKAASALIASRISEGRRIFAAGNGGSAAQAAHFVAELVGRYRLEREALPAVCLNADLASITAIANDYGYEEVFARQLRANARSGDCLVTYSTSGRSPNALAGARFAKAQGIWTLALTGATPNPLASISDASICVNSIDTPRIQEAHLVLTHLLVEEIERCLFKNLG
jgi:D-sedoheptulose 7-phosphate isomerase